MAPHDRANGFKHSVLKQAKAVDDYTIIFGKHTWSTQALLTPLLLLMFLFAFALHRMMAKQSAFNISEATPAFSCQVYARTSLHIVHLFDRCPIFRNYFGQ